jgi:hypothetical protein
VAGVWVFLSQQKVTDTRSTGTHVQFHAITKVSNPQVTTACLTGLDAQGVNLHRGSQGVEAATIMQHLDSVIERNSNQQFQFANHAALDT